MFCWYSPFVFCCVGIYFWCFVSVYCAGVCSWCVEIEILVLVLAFAKVLPHVLLCLDGTCGTLLCQPQFTHSCSAMFACDVWLHCSSRASTIPTTLQLSVSLYNSISLYNLSISLCQHIRRTLTHQPHRRRRPPTARHCPTANAPPRSAASSTTRTLRQQSRTTARARTFRTQWGRPAGEGRLHLHGASCRAVLVWCTQQHNCG